MREISVCSKCRSKNIDYLGKGRCFCYDCKEETEAKDILVESPRERLRSQVYATGNRWAIESFNATH